MGKTEDLSHSNLIALEGDMKLQFNLLTSHGGGGGGHDRTVVTHSPPPMRSAVQTLDPMWGSWWLLTDDRQFTVQNLDQLYVLVFSAHKTTCCDMTCTMLEVMLKPK